MRVSGDYDDRAYLCKSQKWVGLSSEQCPKTSHFSGVAITWIPALILARICSFFSSVSFDSWAGFFVGLSSFICWVISLFLIDKIIHLFSSQWERGPSKTLLTSWQFPILFLLNVPVIYFSTARTFLAHPAELMWSLLFVYFWKKEQLYFAVVALGVLIFTRPNNIGATLPIFAAFLNQGSLSSSKKLPFILLMFASILGFIFFSFKLILQGYNGSYLVPMLLDFNRERLLAFLFREDFGILWAQTAWVVSLLIWVVYFLKGSDFFVSSGFWLLASGAIALFWPTHGSTFGYRYLIGSYGGVLIILLEGLPKIISNCGKRSIKVISTLMVFFSTWNLVQCWTYPAPKPYWPWGKPIDMTLGFPYGQFFNWLKLSPDLINMNHFSQLGQFFEKLGLIAASEYTNRGVTDQYSLPGTLGWFNFFITGAILIFVVIGSAALFKSNEDIRIRKVLRK